MLNLQESGEMYLESVYVLSRKIGNVRSLDVAEYMGFSKPSVSRAVGLLKEGGYLVSDSNGYLVLTALGEERARKIYERHMILSEVLVAIGVEPKIAAEDACRVEHVISDETFDAVKRHVEMKKAKNE